MLRCWRVAGLVAAVYAHFLLFAQFAWIELMRGHGGGGVVEKVALGLMAVGGIGGGVAAARWRMSWGVLRMTMGFSAVVAVVAPWVASGWMAVVVSLGVGSGIGISTVVLAARLPEVGRVEWVGVGTGLGYAVCNVPWIFSASPVDQSRWAAVFLVLGVVLVGGGRRGEGSSGRDGDREKSGMWREIRMVAMLTALVWFDSAAFFVIQHEGVLKSATWGAGQLWRNAGLHFGAAVFAGWWLRRSWVGPLLAAWCLLAAAVWILGRSELREFAGFGYPLGVSLYSLVLVAWPGFGRVEMDERARFRRAAWVFGVAGWFGSANGIGMVQSMHEVPPGFLVASGLVVVWGCSLAERRSWRGWLGGFLLVWMAWWMGSGDSGERMIPKERDAVLEEGRRVYLAEGCIHCHSRYVRPGSIEGLPWGPESEGSPDREPVMIGNRRQGPDLSWVGLRRSEAWLREHFKEPRVLVPGSVMPSYARLFEDGRGEALIRWLRQVDGDAAMERQKAILEWKPQGVAVSRDEANRMYQQHCLMCHGVEARGDGVLAERWARKPANLIEGPWVWTGGVEGRDERMARVIRFGLAGTDMPGHEFLSDAEVLGLVRWLSEKREEAAKER